PRPPAPATPMLATPEAWLWPNAVFPSFTSPFGLLKFAIASCPTDTVWPAPKVAVSVPSEVIETPVTCPGADPFWLMDEVAEDAAYCVRVVFPFESRMPQERELAAAPSVQVGVV